MKKFLFLMILGLGISCTDTSNKNSSTDTTTKTKDTVVNTSPSISEIEADLKKKGYQTFNYKEGDTTYLMQQYFMVFLKTGPDRNQDSTQVAELQKKHLAHLTRMYEEGYTSLTGPMGDDGELRGIVIYNTATQKEADSLANLDPMVQAGRLTVEVHPWWVAKGGKLK